MVLCKCGCGEEIISKSFHKYYGIPEYIKNHNHIGKTQSNEHKRKKNEACSHTLKGRHLSPDTEFKKGNQSPMLGKHHSVISKQKISKNKPDQFGSNNPNYKLPEDRISPLNEGIRQSSQYKEWRLQVFGRDNFTCQHCNTRGVYLEAHHIKGFALIRNEYNIKNIEEAISCSELWNITNGITLCKECHNKTKRG